MGYRKRWVDAKAEFFKLTGQKNPRPKVQGFFANSRTGLTDALRKIDDFMSAHGMEGSPSAFKTLCDAFGSCSTKYISLLDKLIRELDVKELDGSKDRMRTGLVFLEKNLKSYESDFQDYLQQISTKEVELDALIDAIWARGLSGVRTALSRYEACVAWEEVVLKENGSAERRANLWNERFRPVASQIALAARGCADALNMACEVSKHNRNHPVQGDPCCKQYQLSVGFDKCEGVAQAKDDLMALVRSGEARTLGDVATRRSSLALRIVQLCEALGLQLPRDPNFRRDSRILDDSLRRQSVQLEPDAVQQSEIPYAERPIHRAQ
jgi:hypothetical protein